MTHSSVAAIPTITIGLDVGDRFSHYCELDEAGVVVAEGRMQTTGVALRRHFASCARARVVLEVGTHSPWMSRLLEELGHEVIVANARRVRMIYSNDSKNDRVDAEMLARVGRMDVRLLHPIRHRGPEVQTDLALLRSRECLVRARTQLINHVRGATKSVGARISSCSTPAFARRAQAEIPDMLRPALEPLIELIAVLTQQIRSADREIERHCDERYPETHRLRQIHGVGPITSLCYVLTLEDPARFKSGRSVGAYLGLRPRQRDSGDRAPQLRITKRGDAMLRRLLVNAAQYILGPFGPDCDLRRWGLALAERGGANAKKRAVVAVARKLAQVLYALWVTDADYEPFRTSAQAAA